MIAHDLIKFNWKDFVVSLRVHGFNAEYQTIADDDNEVVADEVAIYDEDNKIQLFYITDEEAASWYRKSYLNDFKRKHDMAFFKAEIKKYVPKAKIKF